jgi:hypothetical protein
MVSIEMNESNLIALGDLKYGNVVHLEPPLTQETFYFVKLKTVHYYAEAERESSYYELVFEWREMDSLCNISVLSTNLQEKVYFVTAS